MKEGKIAGKVFYSAKMEIGNVQEGQGFTRLDALWALYEDIEDAASTAKAETINKMLKEAEKGRDLKDGEICPVCGHIEGDC